MKKRMKNSESQRHMYVFLAAVVLIVVVLFCAGGVVKNITAETGYIPASKIEALGRVHYRFRAIYSGSDVSAHHSGGSAPSVSVPAVSVSAPTGHHASAAAAPSAAVAPNVGFSGANGGSYAVYTSSSQTFNSYGGGSSMTGAAGGWNASAAPSANSGFASVSSAPMAYTAVALPSRLRQPLTAEASVDDYPAVRAAGPMRAEAKPVGDGSDGQVSPGGEWYWDSEDWEWKQVGSSSRPDDLSQVGTPVGDMPCLLLLLLCCAYVAMAAYRRRKDAL